MAVTFAVDTIQYAANGSKSVDRHVCSSTMEAVFIDNVVKPAEYDKRTGASSGTVCLGLLSAANMPAA